MPPASIAALQASIESLRRKQSDVAAFCLLWRSQDDLQRALPPRYREVMEDLLGRLESGAAFSEESCSYSQDELLAALQDWLNKAGTKLKD